jgi:hypothetical protein
MVGRADGGMVGRGGMTRVTAEGQQASALRATGSRDPLIAGLDEIDAALAVLGVLRNVQRDSRCREVFEGQENFTE